MVDSSDLPCYIACYTESKFDKFTIFIRGTAHCWSINAVFVSSLHKPYLNIYHNCNIICSVHNVWTFRLVLKYSCHSVWTLRLVLKYSCHSVRTLRLVLKYFCHSVRTLRLILKYSCHSVQTLRLVLNKVFLSFCTDFALSTIVVLSQMCTLA